MHTLIQSFTALIAITIWILSKIEFSLIADYQDSGGLERLTTGVRDTYGTDTGR